MHTLWGQNSIRGRQTEVSVVSEKRQRVQQPLDLHIMRAAYQAGINRRCLVQNIAAPSPLAHGWMQDENGKLAFKWLSIPDVPPFVSDFVRCSCKSSVCEHGHCSCRKHSLHCNPYCSCVECLNRDFDEIDDESHSESDEEELCDSSLSDDE